MTVKPGLVYQFWWLRHFSTINQSSIIFHVTISTHIYPYLGLVKAHPYQVTIFHGGFHSMGVARKITGWFLLGNRLKKWMITRGSRVALWLRKPPNINPWLFGIAISAISAISHHFASRSVSVIPFSSKLCACGTSDKTAQTFDPPNLGM